MKLPRLRRSGGAPEGAGLDPELQAQIGAQPLWMYPWDLGGQQVPILNGELPSVHKTRAEMIEPHVRAALKAAGPDARCLDIACSEGWFSHRLLEWGAGSVVGADLREGNVRRAELVRDHFGISPDKLEFIVSDVFDLDAETLGQFDVVLCLGLVYHLENPVGAVRVTRALTKSLCVIESQLTKLNEPIKHGWGTVNDVLSAEASFAAFVEFDASYNPIASGEGIFSLVPNRAALEQMTRAAGFREVVYAKAAENHDPQYVLGDRGIVLATP